MGVASGVRCVDCGADAPELGDYGSMGLPSLSTEKRAGEAQNFGYLFVGFRAIGLVTLELVDFLDFLKKHDGHELVTHADGEEESFDSEDFDDEEDDWGDDWEDDWGDEELWDDEGLDEDHQRSTVELAAKVDALLQHLLSPVEKLPESGYVPSHYELTCRDCDDSFRTEASDSLHPFRELAIDDARSAVFLNVVGENLDSFYRSEPFSPDDLDGIAGFLDRHFGHSVLARSNPSS